MVKYTPRRAETRGRLILSHRDMAQALGPRTARLGLKPGLALSAARRGRTAPLGAMRGAANQIDQPFDRIGSVAFAGSEPFGGDNDHAVAIEPSPGQAAETVARVRIDRARCLDIEAQLDRCLDLVDVLSARPAGAKKVQFDLALIQSDGRGDANHAAMMHEMRRGVPPVAMLESLLPAFQPEGSNLGMLLR